MKQKKIAILVESLSNGGIQRVAIQLADSFSDEGYEVHLILIKNVIAYDISGKYTIHTLREDGKLTKTSQLRPYLFAKKLKALLHAYGPFALFLSNVGSFDGEKMVAIAKPENLYMVLHNTQSKRRFKRHKASGLRMRMKIRRLQKNYENKDVIAVSKGVAEDAMNIIGIRPNSICTIYNPFDFEHIRELAQLPNDAIPHEHYIIHVARFELKAKRHDILLKAYKLANISQKLVLLGPSPDEEKLKAIIDDLGLTERVIIPGFDANPYSWIKNADLFVFSSDYEGFGNVLMESLIVGTPVVSTNCPSGPSEILTGELSNYLVPTGDYKALSEKMREALAFYPEITHDLINKFSTQVITHQYLDLIKK